MNLPFRAILLSLTLASLWGLASCSGWGIRSASSEREALPRLMVERLEWMDEVARVKLARSLPVTDARREAELLDAMEKLGAASALPAAAVRPFFSGQMEAAKRYQEEWLKAHAGMKETSTPVPDLAKTVRPALDEIGRKMIVALARARRHPEEAADIVHTATEHLARSGCSQAVIASAIQGLESGLKTGR